MKILYIDAPNTKRKYPYYTDLYKALCRKAEVSLLECSKIKNLEKFTANSKAIIIGLGWMSQKSAELYKIVGLRRYGIPIICLLHKPQNLLKHKLYFCKNNANLLVYSQKEHAEYGKIAGIPSMQSWMGGDPKIYKDLGLDRVYDFGFSGALHGGDKIKGATQNLRTRIYNLLKCRTDIKLFWNGSDSIAPRIKSVREYAQKISQTKIWLTTTGPLEDISPRYFEIGLSKTLIFCNRMDAYGDVFRDGQNCVMFNNNLSDFNTKLTHYLNAENERQNIIENAYTEFSTMHTWDCRAGELISRIEQIRKG
jgi:hypothetical protein